MNITKSGMVTAAFLATSLSYAQAPERLLWGDTHVHTSNSFDALIFGNTTVDPDMAHRFARGEPVIHPVSGARIQLHTPLDFVVIADHAETLGVGKEIYYNGTQVEDAGFIEGIKAWLAEYGIRKIVDAEFNWEKLYTLLPHSGDPRTEADNLWKQGQRDLPNREALQAKAWLDSVQQADKYNEPGVFTSLIGWEWSSLPGGANLHRVVVSTADSSSAGGLVPFSSADSPYPEDLWDWMDKTSRETGAQFLAIPHNSNLSKGIMFAETTLRGDALSEQYIRKRSQWEPLAEVTQIKGDSETHPILSPRDEFADFETYTHYIQYEEEDYRVNRGDYIRSALLRGLDFQVKQGDNPFQFGLIGSTDSHTGLATTEENNFGGKLAFDGTPAGKNTPEAPPGVVTGWSMSASGLAAVWAHENTRESIFAAMQRREVYATTGPRISLRVFAGQGFTEKDLDHPQMPEIGYQQGVPMGGELRAYTGDARPQLLIQALKDPGEARLDRVQVIKGWIDDDGNQRESVIDVAWSGDRKVDGNGKLAPVENTVDLSTGRVNNRVGAAELKALWTDSEFNPGQHAFYYVRVLQIPTARHTLLDAIALGLDKPPEGALTIQERAYSSPIWYTPGE